MICTITRSGDCDTEDMNGCFGVGSLCSLIIHIWKKQQWAAEDYKSKAYIKHIKRALISQDLSQVDGDLMSSIKTFLVSC